MKFQSIIFSFAFFHLKNYILKLIVHIICNEVYTFLTNTYSYDIIVSVVDGFFHPLILQKVRNLTKLLTSCIVSIIFSDQTETCTVSAENNVSFSNPYNFLKPVCASLNGVIISLLN